MYGVLRKIHAGALVGFAALVVAATFFVPTSVGATPAAVQAAPLSSDQLQSILLPANAYPNGTVLYKMTYADALAGTGCTSMTDTEPEPIACGAGFMAPSPDLVISPDACGAQAVSTAFGDASGITGWIQTGSLPAGPDGARPEVFGLAATTPGGAQLDRIAANVAACRAGTVSMPALGLSGTVRLAQFPVSGFDGARTFGLLVSTTFGGASAANGAGAMTAAMVFVTTGDLVVIACEPEVQGALNMAQGMYSRALAVVG